jgi:hypothetical protein
MRIDLVARVLLGREHVTKGHHLNRDCIHCAQILITAMQAAARGNGVTEAFIGPMAVLRERDLVAARKPTSAR